MVVQADDIARPGLPTARRSSAWKVIALEICTLLPMRTCFIFMPFL